MTEVTLDRELFLPMKATVQVGNSEPNRPFFPFGHIFHHVEKVRSGRKPESPPKGIGLSLASPVLYIPWRDLLELSSNIAFSFIFNYSLVFSHLGASLQRGFRYVFRKVFHCIYLCEYM